jgi:hypothetical protein
VRFAALAAVLATFAAPAVSHAASGASPRLEISPASLTFVASGDRRALTLTNAGDDVLRLGNVSVLLFDQPQAVQFDVDAPGARDLEPGASVTINVTLHVIGGELPAQVFAALLVPADDPRLPQDLDLRTGAPSARRLAGVALRVGQTHLLTWMIVLPLLGFVLLSVPLVRRARWSGSIAFAAAGLPLLLAGFAAGRFDPAFSFEDGNRGLQAVAHVALSGALGIEYFVGVDGASLLFVLLAPLVGVAALLAARTQEPAARGPKQAALLLVQAGATCAFVARDGALFTLSWVVTAAGAIALVGTRAPRQDGRSSVSPFAAAAVAAVVLLVVGIAALRVHAPASYLHDGTPVAHSLDFTTLAAARLGAPAVAGAAIALFVAFALAMPLFPFHGWAAATFESASPPAALALAGLWSAMGASGLVRLGAGVLPEAARAVSTVLLIVGALGALHAALLAVSELAGGRRAHAGRAGGRAGHQLRARPRGHPLVLARGDARASAGVHVPRRPRRARARRGAWPGLRAGGLGAHAGAGDVRRSRAGGAGDRGAGALGRRRRRRRPRGARRRRRGPRARGCAALLPRRHRHGLRRSASARRRHARPRRPRGRAAAGARPRARGDAGRDERGRGRARALATRTSHDCC